MIQFSQVFYIDADAIVMSDPESIFKFPECEFAAAPDVFPPDCFNAGVLLIKPNFETFKLLID